MIALATSPVLLTVRILGEDKCLGFAHEHKSPHIRSRCEAATDQAEVVEEIPLTRVEVAATLLLIEILGARTTRDIPGAGAQLSVLAEVVSESLAARFGDVHEKVHVGARRLHWPPELVEACEQHLVRVRIRVRVRVDPWGWGCMWGATWTRSRELMLEVEELCACLSGGGGEVVVVVRWWCRWW
eukprot:scaffold9992_cov64-Phaeocystis_antarctica.AAC.2